jgi:hypothetical protein
MQTILPDGSSVTYGGGVVSLGSSMLATHCQHQSMNQQANKAPIVKISFV